MSLTGERSSSFGLSPSTLFLVMVEIHFPDVYSMKKSNTAQG
jgi:hypothetical protein